MTNTAALVPSYAIDQRLAGYADNDGRFVAERVRPLHWSPWGTLRAVGSGRFLGVFDTRAEADAAVAADGAVWAAEPHTDRPLN